MTPISPTKSKPLLSRRTQLNGALLGITATLLAGCGRLPTIDGSPTTSTTTPTGAEPSAAPQDRLQLLATLRIDDYTKPPEYKRERFRTWLDLDKNGCDAREDVLIEESLTPVRTGRLCDVIAGTWFSAYDAATVTDPSQLDIDHMVPLAEAWRAGASEWSADRRAEYANDTTHGETLIAVTASTNRSKGDRAPDQWRPENREAWCDYATDWVTVKVTWNLSATTTERDAIGDMFTLC